MKPLAALLILAVSAAAQSAKPLPLAPSSYIRADKKPPNFWLAPFKDPSFWAGTAFHASSVIADVHHVQSCEANKTCVEANPPADTYSHRIPEIGFIAAGNYGCSMMLSQHKRWRPLCMILPVVIGVAHWRDATTIYTRQR